MRLLLLFFGLAFCESIYAQTDYAVTSKGDTLRGRTKILSYDFYDRVQVVEGKKKKQYTALEVKSVYMDGEIYHTVKYDQTYRYMRLIKPGFLSLYGFRLQNQSSYDGQYLVKKNGASMEVPNLTFKKGMAGFLDECPEVVTKIKNGDLGRRDVDQIIDLFNSCLQFETEKKVSEAAPVVISQEEEANMVAINSLIGKVEGTADFTEKTDVLDLLKDLRSKVGRKEILPNYLTKDIKKNLSSQPQLTEDVDKLLELLKK